MTTPVHIKDEPEREDPLFIKHETDSEFTVEEEELWVPMHQIECTPDIKVEPSGLQYSGARCRWCLYEGASQRDVDAHAKVHDKSCDQCPFVTKHETALWRHKKRFHTLDEDGNPVVPAKREYVKRFQCPACPYRTAHRHALRSHAAKHSQAKDYQCARCDYSTKYSSALRRHALAQHAGGADLRCGRCPFVAADMATLQSHLAAHSDKTYACQLCTFSTGDVSAAFSHAHGGHGLLDWHEIFSSVAQVEVKSEGAELGGSGAEPVEGDAVDSVPPSPPPAAPFACDSCVFTTDDKRALRRHVARHLNDAEKTAPSYQCHMCDYTSRYKGNWKKHMTIHSEVKRSKVKRYKCNECDFQSAYSHAYHRHSKRHRREEKMYQCDQCTFRTKFEGRLSWHLLRIHKVNLNHPFKCDRCDFSSVSSHRLKSHVAKSRADRDMRCVFCDYVTNYRCQLRCHKLRHTEGCEVATADGDTGRPEVQTADVTAPKDFQSHYLAQLELESRPSNGTLDSGALFRKALLKSNLAVRQSKDQERPYSCQQCEYSSRFKGSVLRHYQRRHAAQAKPYRCAHCDFATSTGDSIALHRKRSRLPLEAYCGCGYSTLYKCQLALHKKTHNAFRCTRCPYSCKSRFVLETHMMEHSGVGLKCPVCEFVTPKKAILVYHMASHTGDRRYKCQYCDYSAMRSFLLDNHVRRLHADVLKRQISV